jgi:MFS superfamily sulfate permease-like transporter
VAVAFGILASIVLNTQALGIKLVGPIPAGLPALTLSDVSLLSELWVGALGIGLMSFVESIAAARAFTQRGDQIPTANQSCRHFPQQSALLEAGECSVNGD